jgi:hypothetical protein
MGFEKMKWRTCWKNQVKTVLAEKGLAWLLEKLTQEDIFV